MCFTSCCSPRNGGRPCVGVHIRYKTCNTQKCTVDHVAVPKQNQCQAKNSRWRTLSHGKNAHMVHFGPVVHLDLAADKLVLVIAASDVIWAATILIQSSAMNEEECHMQAYLDGLRWRMVGAFLY